MINNYTINIIVHNNISPQPVIDSLKPLNAVVFDGTGYPSFSKVCNDIIVKNPTPIVIIAGYKVRPTQKDVNKMLKLINEGHGIVGLYRFGFFGFKKELIHRIGFFDERFIGGEYEDGDMIRRHMLNNISIYEQEEVVYIYKKSTWNNKLSKLHHYKKWKDINENSYIRLLDDEKYNYDIGKSDSRIIFLKAKYSVIVNGNINGWIKSFHPENN